MSLYDVLAVNLSTKVVRILAKRKTKSNAEHIAYFAVMRRGVETEFYPIVEADSYNEGDWYQGESR